MKSIYINFILPYLLFHANKLPNQQFYLIKKKLLMEYATHIRFDVQFIDGQFCYECAGLGTIIFFDGIDDCPDCFGSGWYKRPQWNVLKKVKFGDYYFHIPIDKCFKEPESLNHVLKINGYINHEPSKISRQCRIILSLIYEDGYFKRCWSKAGLIWYEQWWIPKYYFGNFIHLIKYRCNATPFQKWRRWKLMREQFKKPITDDDLPF